ncbi:unnamed protein product, partial [Laminaria digitata]
AQSNQAEVLTVAEAAKAMRVDQKTLYTAVNDGLVPARRVGRRIVILRQALLEWLSGRDGEENR